MDLLVEKLKLASITKARNLVKQGSVYVDGERVERGEYVVQEGQTIEIKGAEKKERVHKAPFELLYEDDAIVVAVKPAGILSVNRDNEQSLTFHKKVNLYVRERSRNKERVFLVHRLDREVSGVMIFAKSLAIQAKLEERWRENDKRYYALVEGHLPQKEGKAESWLCENAQLKVYSTTQNANAKLAVSHYQVLKEWPRHSLVEVRLDTGRKHQIRVHMSDLGCPIVGDKKYGAKSDPLGRIMLHAFRLAFHHPLSGVFMTFESPFEQSLIERGRAGF